MLVLDELEAAAAIERIRLNLRSLGVEVRQENNPTKALVTLNRLNECSDDAKIATWLDPNLTIMTERSAFWLFCYDRSWSPIGKTACRIDDTNSESYGAFAARALKVIHRDNDGFSKQDRFPKAAYDFSGRIAFCGDTFLDPNWRDQRIPKLLISINYIVMAQKWGVPDWTTCFLRPRQAADWDWTQRYWSWHHDTASFIEPSDTNFRGHSLGVLSRDGFVSEVREAVALRLPLLPVQDSRQRNDQDPSCQSDPVVAEN